MQAGRGLADASEAELATEDGHGFKERRRVFSSADCDPDGLEHGTSLESERSGGSAKGLVQRIVIEKGRRKDFKRVLKNAASESGIALLGDQVGRVVGSELGQEEEIGRRNSVAQELDALANERGDGEEFFRRCVKPSAMSL